MINKKNIFLLYALILFELIILYKSKTVMEGVTSSSLMFILKIFPYLFPSMVIGNLLVKNNVQLIIPNFIKKIFNKLFNFNNVMTSIFIISIFTGSPSNAVYINECLNSGKLNVNDAQRLLLTTHFINPLFIIGGVGLGVFNSAKAGFLLIFMMLISNLFKAYVLKTKISSTSEKLNLNNEQFTSTLTSSIKKSINSCLLIFGIVIMFNVLVSLIKNIFNLNIILSTIINGILEMTGGVILLGNLSINPAIKFILAYFFLNFGGLCIQMQTLSMIENKKIRYLKYLIFRLF